MFNDLVKTLIDRDNQAPGDYLDGEGFLVCGKCRTRKQYALSFPLDLANRLGCAPDKRVAVACDCAMAALKADEEAEKRREFNIRLEALRRDGITDPAYLRHTFDKDDGQNPKISEACRRYAQMWEDMKRENMGILFSGDVGTGKTFLACCIANAVLDKLSSVSVTSLPHILNRLQSAYGGEGRSITEDLQRYALLVIDDLGVERATAYAEEQVFNIVDARARSGKPLIVTTNLSVQDLQSAQSPAQKRIYDRILEMCPIRLTLTGESRRKANTTTRRSRARELLGGGLNGEA